MPQTPSEPRSPQLRPQPQALSTRPRSGAFDGRPDGATGRHEPRPGAHRRPADCRRSRPVRGLLAPGHDPSAPARRVVPAVGAAWPTHRWSSTAAAVLIGVMRWMLLVAVVAAMLVALVSSTWSCSYRTPASSTGDCRRGRPHRGKSPLRAGRPRYSPELSTCVSDDVGRWAGSRYAGGLSALAALTRSCRASLPVAASCHMWSTAAR